MALPYTPMDLLNNILPQALTCTKIVYAQQSGSPTFTKSGTFAFPIYKQIVNTPGFKEIVASICYNESRFNWTVMGNPPSNGPIGNAYGKPGYVTYYENYVAAHQLQAPGILWPPTQENQLTVYSLETCFPLNAASRAQSITQCLGTNHLKNHKYSPFLAVPIGEQLIMDIYEPDVTGNYGINGIYNGPNTFAGAINGFVAMLCLMASSLQSGEPITQPWASENVNHVQQGAAILAGKTIPQNQTIQGPGSTSSNGQITYVGGQPTAQPLSC